MRYALYHAPAVDSAWWRAGCRWLGYDACSGERLPYPELSGMSPLILDRLCSSARRYGFHATLKAPFNLAPGCTEAQVLHMANTFCATQSPVLIEDLAIRPLDHFLAVRPAANSNDLRELAMRCLSFFDVLRAPAAEHELIRRRRAGLTARQEALLQKWGYPYVEDEYRYHLTLTDPMVDIDVELQYQVRRSAERCFADAMRTEPSMMIDHLAIFREPHDGAPFECWARIPFQASSEERELPDKGMLVVCTGAPTTHLVRSIEALRSLLIDQASMTGGHPHPWLLATVDVAGSEPWPGATVVSHAQFWQRVDEGAYACHWDFGAYGIGVRRGFEPDLMCGRHVIACLPGKCLPHARACFPGLRMVVLHEANDEAMSAPLRVGSAGVTSDVVLRLDPRHSPVKEARHMLGCLHALTQQAT